MLHLLKNVDRLLLQLLRLLPKVLLSRMTGVLARIPFPFPLNVLIIRTYAAFTRADLSEAEFPPSKYYTLNAFFTRKLKPGTRPLVQDPGAIVSPVDGRIMEQGRVTNGSMLQAKEWHFTLRDLLMDPGQSTHFLEGAFCTIYLSPRDYHRIHLPLDGAVESMHYIPGQLFPVNAFSLSRIRNLFVINERLIVYLKTGLGKVAMIMVGATNVGKIRILFDEIRTNSFRQGPFQRTYNPEILLKKGEEMGCFELGSTVILLFEKDQVELSLKKGDPIKVGEAMGFTLDALNHKS